MAFYWFFEDVSPVRRLKDEYCELVDDLNYQIKRIEEKICGNSSGWMYSVNNDFPGQNAGSYRLKDGDNIKWRFTCKPGDLK